MKKMLIILIVLGFISCTNDEENITSSSVETTFRFTHNWDGATVTSADFNTIQYTNANGDQLSIERLRYVISNITFTGNSGEVLNLSGHNLVDVTNNNTTFNLTTRIPAGTYQNVSFTFGLNNEDNAQNLPDLNSASFNVPDMLGGGYHYMQFDGKYIASNNTEQGFNYHAIRAVDNPGANHTFPQDTFFTVNLGTVTITNTSEIEVEMNIAEWFRSPNTWDLNVYNQMLMPNSTAQILMFENGQNVFSLGQITTLSDN